MRGGIFGWIKAARFERSMIALSYIMIPVALVGVMTFDIFCLMVACIFTYAAAGLYNAKADGDFDVKSVNVVILIFSIIAFIFSLSNYFITLTMFAGLLVGYVYNRPARKILLGDAVALPVAHILVPMVSAALILDIEILEILPLSLVLMIPFAFSVQMKNLKGVDQDRENGYKTLMTIVENGRLHTYVFLKISFLMILFIYFLFNFSERFLLVVFMICGIYSVMDYFIYIGQELRAHGLTRLVTMAVPFAVVLDYGGWFCLVNIFLLGVYLVFYLVKFEGMEVNGS